MFDDNCTSLQITSKTQFPFIYFQLQEIEVPGQHVSSMKTPQPTVKKLKIMEGINLALDSDLTDKFPALEEIR